MKKNLLILCMAILSIGLISIAWGRTGATSGIGGVAWRAKENLGNFALLITAGAYVAGMGFAVGAIAKFMAHKTNPQQVPISQPIALLFVAVALMFAPAVFRATGQTLFSGGQVGTISGVTTF